MKFKSGIGNLDLEIKKVNVRSRIPDLTEYSVYGALTKTIWTSCHLHCMERWHEIKPAAQSPTNLCSMCFVCLQNNLVCRTKRPRRNYWYRCCRPVIVYIRC